jgi:hypothetical protein
MSYIVGDYATMSDKESQTPVPNEPTGNPVQSRFDYQRGNKNDELLNAGYLKFNNKRIGGI